MEDQLAAAIDAELGGLAHARRALAPVRWSVPAEQNQPLQLRTAIVAADAGNVRLRLNPLRIAVVRVAASDREEPLGELVFPSEIQAEALEDRLTKEVPNLVEPLRKAGVNVTRLLASASGRRDRLAAIREVLEWGAVLQVMSTGGTPRLVVRDGLLRSIHFDTDSFRKLADALGAAAELTGNALVAVAKHVPGGADLANALMLGDALRRPPGRLAWLEIPYALERALLPGSFVVGRRMGPLLLVRAQTSAQLVPVELGPGAAVDPARALASLFGADAEWFPEPGWPAELTMAHERARISALDREWLRAAFLDRLAARDPRLARRALAAEVLGVGGTLVTEEPPT